MKLHEPENGSLSPRVEQSDGCTVVLLLDVVFAKTILSATDVKVDTIIAVANATENNAKDVGIFVSIFMLSKTILN